MDKRPKRITNKYFNSNGNKEEKQPHTHYPQGNRTSNYYCKSNPQGSQEKQPPQVVPRSSLTGLEFFIRLELPYHQITSFFVTNIGFFLLHKIVGEFLFFSAAAPRAQKIKFMCKMISLCAKIKFVCSLCASYFTENQIINS